MPSQDSDRIAPAVTAILIVSAAAVALIFWIVYFRQPAEDAAPYWAASLRAVNATLNSLSAVCIALGIVAIRGGHRRRHIGLMTGALAASGAFLVTYLAYYYFHGDSKFLGEGWIRPVYFFILISHILLSVAVVPLVFLNVFFGVTARYVPHIRLGRITWPIWLYVSVTGVAVYVLLRFFGGGG